MCRPSEKASITNHLVEAKRLLTPRPAFPQPRRNIRQTPSIDFHYRDCRKAWE
ncbi:uncharacterized protein BDW43DRAFT_283678 [Aspergillus alliaceus]|uniref:uncharacterized protein n=1 Tax=Petromyces alliaceus TaxID=209559 RepID=UPI0012A68C0A|nr:uncharacterized protein BDW43DRAFT_283678 [Aspergillus alliaceus]KAB8230889.1 hypothetical protein BDW43DRAFT_283678 [Aspergillus alliaceus]